MVALDNDKVNAREKVQCPALVALALAASSAALGGCSLYKDAPADLGPSATSFVEDMDLPTSRPQHIDLLFVIDDSPAIAPYEDAVRENLPRFADTLDEFQGGFPDTHIGFIAGDDPVLHGGSGVTGSYIESVPHLVGPPDQNFTDLAAAFRSLGDLGAAGSPDQPLLATAVRALVDSRNGHFRRPDADLVVVVIAPADDHSLASIDTLAAQVALLARPPRVVVAGVITPGAPRMTAFLDSFPNRSSVVDIRHEDLTDSLLLFRPSLGTEKISSPCMQGALVDADPTAPGLQPICAVSDVQHLDHPEQTEQRLSACDVTGSARPCWRITVQPEICPIGSQLALEVLRADFAPDDDHVIAQCEVE